MCLGKSTNAIIFDVETRAITPRAIATFRTGLNQTKGRTRSGKGVAIVRIADKRIHISRIVGQLLLRGNRVRKQTAEKYKDQRSVHSGRDLVYVIPLISSEGSNRLSLCCNQVCIVKISESITDCDGLRNFVRAQFHQVLPPLLRRSCPIELFVSTGNFKTSYLCVHEFKCANTSRAIIRNIIKNNRCFPVLKPYLFHCRRIRQKTVCVISMFKGNGSQAHSDLFFLWRMYMVRVPKVCSCRDRSIGNYLQCPVLRFNR